MYEQFYNFSEKPFQLAPNPVFLFKGLKHQKALTYLEYGLVENVGFIVLSGEVGSGKTTTTQYMLNILGAKFLTAVISNTNLTVEQLLQMILREFGLLPTGKNKADHINSLNKFLHEKYAEGKRLLLVIDEAQNLSLEVLEEVRMLSNLQQGNDQLLQIMLVGQPELLHRLKKPELRQLAQRVAIHYHLTALGRQETHAYIVHRLEVVGGRKDLFTPAAVAMIYKLTGGVPRSINLVCQAALAYGFADDAKIIDQNIIRQLYQDKVVIGIHVNSKDPGNGKPLSEGNDLERQLANLQAGISHLSERLTLRMDNLEKTTSSSQERLIKRLNQILHQERRRNQQLALQVSTLKQRRF